MNKEKRASQFGRSMIEMLGVLAIIGVLSVGGISGYTEAMRKYKMTKTIEIVRASLFRLMEINQMKHGGYEWINSVDLYVATGLLPEEICDKDYVDAWGTTGDACQLPLGEIVMNLGFSDGMPMSGQYSITFTDGDKERNCVDFLSYHWEKITPKDWWASERGGVLSVYSDDTDVYIYTGNKEYGEQYNLPTELTMDNIAKSCHQYCGDTVCGVGMRFR